MEFPALKAREAPVDAVVRWRHHTPYSKLKDFLLEKGAGYLYDEYLDEINSLCDEYSAYRERLHNYYEFADDEDEAPKMCSTDAVDAIENRIFEALSSG